MKIEIDLLEIDRAASGPKLARTCAVALLSALPQDEAELAIDEWRAMLKVCQQDAEAHHLMEASAEARYAAAEAVVDIADTFAPPESAALDSTPLKSAPTDTNATLEKKKDAPNEGVPNQGTPLDDQEMSAKTVNALVRAGYRTLEDLQSKTVKELREMVDRFGKKGAEELTAVMQAAGLWPEPYNDSTLVFNRDGTEAEPAELAEPATAEPSVQPASTTSYDSKLPLRGPEGLVRQAEKQIGRPKVWEIFEEKKLKRIPAEDDPIAGEFRAALLVAMAT